MDHHQSELSPRPDAEPHVSPKNSMITNHEPREPPRAPEHRGVAARKDLRWWDVAALIINKMVGTGIFTGPAMVFEATQNKTHAAVFWALGLFYSLTSAWLYLEYSRDLMYNGGELVYLDHTMTATVRHKRFLGRLRTWPRFRLLAYTLYAFYFVFIYTTTTNAMQFGRQVLIAVSPDDAETDAIDQRMVRFIAVVITSVVGLLILWSSSTALFMNAVTATAKIVLLLAVMSAGAWRLGHDPVPGAGSDWAETVNHRPSNWALGMLLVFFSFHGWDNATLVAGEIPDYDVLRLGFLAGVSIVGVLYVVLAVILGFSFAWNQGDPPINYMSTYFGGSHAAVVAAAVLTAISAFGSMVSVTYTCTRVKQAIAWSSIFPGSNYWRRSAPQHSQDPTRSRQNPEGASTIHWLVTVFYICVTAAIPNLQDAISFSGNLLVYGHFLFEVVGFAFIFSFKPGEVSGPRSPERVAPDPPAWLRPKGAPWLGPFLLGSIPALFSCVILVAVPVQRSDRVYLYVTVAVLAAAALYWAALRLNATKLLGIIHRRLAVDLEIATHTRPGFDERARECLLCEVAVTSPDPEEHRHDMDGYLHYIRQRREPNGAILGHHPEEDGISMMSMTGLPRAACGPQTNAGLSPTRRRTFSDGVA